MKSAIVFLISVAVGMTAGTVLKAYWWPDLNIYLWIGCWVAGMALWRVIRMIPSFHLDPVVRITLSITVLFGDYTAYIKTFNDWATPYLENGYEVDKVTERKKYLVTGPKVITLQLKKVLKYEKETN